MKNTVLAIAALAACCSFADAAGAIPSPDGKLKVVAVSFPEYDWTRNIVGDTGRAELVLLQKNGADLHSYSPSASDLREVAACDLLVHVGGESDEWVEGALACGGKKDRKVVNLIDALGGRIKRNRHDGKEEPDEHVWLSLRNAAVLSGAIAEALAAVDPASADAYRGNAKAYCGKLQALDAEYAKTVSAGARKTVLFADRFPFRYMTDDYGLEYYAAFPGCSAESEASFKTIRFLAGKVDEFKLPVILKTDGGRHRIPETVRDASKSRGQKILAMDSLQSVPADKIEETAYLDVMRGNLSVLAEALR